MMTVKKANVFLDIDDEDLQKYLNLGYCQVDPKTGAVLVACIPTDVGELQVAYAQHTKKIAELEAEISKLKKQKAKAKD